MSVSKRLRFKVLRRERYAIYIDFAGTYKAGDPPPSGYCDWHDWAEVQTKAGLKQRECWSCGKYRFPQEACCGPEPPDLHAAAFTVDDIIEVRVDRAAKKRKGPR